MDYLCLVICLLLAWVGIRVILTTVKKDGEPNLGRLPPGPPGLPIFGNLLSLGTKPHITVTELAKTYGPLMCLQLGRVPTVVISSAVIAKEALQKNDQLFSNRMVTDALHVFNHHEDSLVLLPTSSRWRNLRKICNSLVFSSSKLDANRSIRREKVNDLLSYVQNNSEAGLAVDICQAVSTTMLNLLSNTFFSTDLGDPNTEMARGFKETVRGILEEAGKPNFADYFPILKKIDPQGIRRRTGKHYQNIYGLLNSIIDQRLQEKRPTSSEQGKDVLDALLDINQEKNENFKPAKIPNLLLDLFIAGTDTTSTTLEWAMAELLRHPEKLKKARVELQEAIGNGKPVEESDISRLPYLQAIIKETFRLHPVTPFLVPRRVDSSIKLSGFIVPKNAQVFVNVWAIGRDPDIWENPNEFQPERFMGSKIEVKGNDFELIPFGAGRRICPGMPLALRMLHLILGSLIYHFEWKLEDGVSAEHIDMEERFGFTLEKAQRLRAIPVRV